NCGVAPFTFSIATGTPPPGITISSSGLLSGTPTTTGTFNFTVKAVDANSASGTRDYTLIVAASSVIATLSIVTPVGVGVNKNNNRIYVANNGSNNIAVID